MSEPECTCDDTVGNRDTSKRSCRVHGDQIQILLSDIGEKLEALEKNQADELDQLKQFMQSIETAKMRARLQGRANTEVRIPAERFLQGFRGANEERAVITECIKIVIALIGSIIVQVEPGKVETLAGQKILAFTQTVDGEVDQVTTKVSIPDTRPKMPCYGY